MVNVHTKNAEACYLTLTCIKTSFIQRSLFFFNGVTINSKSQGKGENRMLHVFLTISSHNPQLVRKLAQLQIISSLLLYTVNGYSSKSLKTIFCDNLRSVSLNLPQLFVAHKAYSFKPSSSYMLQYGTMFFKMTENIYYIRFEKQNLEFMSSLLCSCLDFSHPVH